MHLPPTLPTIMLALLAPTVATQTSLCLLEGVSPNNLRVSVLDEGNLTNPRRIVLSGIEVLPLEITNRTLQQSLLADRPRLSNEQDVPRLELGGNGRLLRYARRAANRWGFLWVEANGNPRVVLELAGNVDPFADRFGIAPDGRHAAMVTKAGAIWAVRLDGADYASTGTPARRLNVPDTVDEVSVCVGTSHVFFHTEDDRIWRAALTDGAVPQNMTPASTGSVRLKEEMAPSGDGSAVAFLYGPQDRYRLYLLRSQGAATRLSPPAAKYEEPGYLPETPRGPRMLLNDDASRLLYTDATNREEIFLLDTSNATATTHLTSNPNFEPYIGTGIYPIFVSGIVLIAIGDVTGFDWFTAITGSPGVVNITTTAPQGPPYFPGTLAPTLGWATSGGGMLIEESNATGGIDLRHIDPSAGTTSILTSELRGPLQAGRAGTGAAPNILIPTQLGDSLVSSALKALVTAPPGVLLSPDEQFPGGNASVFVASIPAFGLSAALFAVPGGGLSSLPPDPELRQAVVTPGAGLLLNGRQLVYASAITTAVLASELPIRIVLSHAQ